MLSTAACIPRRAPAARWFAALPAGWAVLAASALLVAVVLDDPVGGEVLAVAAALLSATWWVRSWAWGYLAVQTLTVATTAAIAYLAYAAVQAFTAGLGVLGVTASVVLLVLEAAALALAVSYAFEILDVLGRRTLAEEAAPDAPAPAVCLQVPTYNEPVEVVGETLRSLAAVEYPRLLVQVVDNNTTDPEVWRPLQRLCEELGPRFTFLHLENWPGFKAGALNEATRRLPREIEVVGIVDADYVVRPDFLRAMVGHFADPSVAFVQTSQHYRDWEDDAYLRGLFHSYRYFFDVSMPARAHRNAIIFCGTMGLIRRSALEEIGGWDEACITEDAEASLRMLGRGHRGVYHRAAFGAGLMPLSFDGLKKQRFRWALGGLQILRRHRRELLPFAHHRLRLTRAQRVHYLLGSLQWLGEPLTALFTLLLLLTAVATGLHHRLPLRQLTGAVMVIPLAFLLSGVARALWAMRRTTGCTWRDALAALRVWFALSWVVTLACVRGLFSDQAEFLRTPKRRDDEGSVRRALRSSRFETCMAAAAVLAALAMLIRAPAAATLVLAALLVFEGGVYGCAVWAGAAAEGVVLTPLRRAYARSSQSTGDRPPWRRPAVAVPGALAVALGAGLAAALVLTSPSDQAPFRGQSDLPRIGSVAHGLPAPSLPVTGPTPTASPSPAPATEAPAPTATPAATGSPTSGAAPTQAPAATPTP